MLPCSDVSIVMPVYNGEAYLQDAVNSVLAQSLTKFELIIINDGSTDNTRPILDWYADNRIIVKHREHEGLVASLNEALSMARGNYIARMDCDDIAHPERLRRQANFLERHPSVGLLGTTCEEIDAKGHSSGFVEFPIDDMNIRWTSLLNNPFAHPSVMLRREMLEQHKLAYDPNYETVEDYELWMRVLQHTQGANLPEPLVKYRRHGQGICSNTTEVQMTNHDRVALRTIHRELPEVRITIEQVGQLRRLFVERDQLVDGAERVALAKLYLRLLSAFTDRQRDRKTVRRLEHYEAMKVARLGLIPGRKADLHLIKHLAALNPLMPAYALLFLPKAIRTVWRKRAT